jgi:RNA polymerase sigma-70 factor (ECF subfamily)
MSAPDHPSDDDLIARIGRGDREAFASLYRRRRGDVYRFALLMSGSAALADDVTQDVFVEVIHHAGRYRPGYSGVVPWLFGIARNHARRAHARQRPSISLPDGESQRPGPFTVEYDPVAGMARRQHVAALRRAVLELPITYREAIVLCDLQELSYADAAAALDCAVGTVRSRLHRGRALLAVRLRGEDEALLQTPVPRCTP